MAIDTIDTSYLDINTSRRLWHIHMPGRVVFGNGYTRPVQVVNGKAMYTGVRPPRYTVEPGAGGAGKITGTVNVAVVFYRALGKDRSLPKYSMYSAQLTGQELMLDYFKFSETDDPFVTHREIYVNIEEIGGWYRAAVWPYSPLDPDIEPPGPGIEVIDFDPSWLITQRPLEDQLQTSIFPAVDCAAFWNGSVYGGRLPGRPLAKAPGTTITFTSQSDTITINGGTFWESDRYKPLMRDGNIICFIWDPAPDGLSAKIKLPASTSETPDPWDGSTETVDVFNRNIHIGAEEQTIYISSTYIGEEGNGITRGWVTWNPLNQLRDEYQTSVGSRITAMGHDRENLVVFFDRAIVAYSGDPGLDVPTPRSVTLSNSIGSLAPHHVWNTRDGGLWWLTRNRIFTLVGSEVTDVTAAWGNASIFDKHFEADDASNFYNWNVAYNPTTHQTLIVNMAEPGSADHEDTRAESFGRMALLVDHGRQAFYKLQFPVRIKTISCVPRRDGRWAWFCVAASAVQPGEASGVPVTSFFCTLFRDGDVDNVETATPILWEARPAMRRAGGHSIPVGERLLLEADFQAPETTTVYKSSVVAERTMVHGSDETLFSRDVTIKDVRTKDWIAYNRSKDAVGVQRVWSGQVDSGHARTRLLEALIVDDIVPLRGFDQ